mmetsp:Transcript_13564/g.17682  ORF Transcript_13564/g.17682 Transcript_13564/m.17682 type:complete len:297 (+) Transcript_13564:183-1073(+)
METNYPDTPTTPTHDEGFEDRGSGFINGLEYGWREQVGRRYKGEDLVSVSSENPSVVTVFDGHRGRNMAEYCAKKFLELLRDEETGIHELSKVETEAKFHEEVKSFLNDSFVRCHEDARSERVRSGTTLVMVYLYEVGIGNGEKHVYGICANAGDARAVLYADGKARRISCDHKASNPEEEKRIVEAGGKVVFGDLYGLLEVSRGIGDFDMEPGFIPNPFISDPIKLCDHEDGFVILASDGLWDVVNDQEAVQAVKSKLDSGGTAMACAVMLTELAQSKRSRDDISVLILLFKHAY